MHWLLISSNYAVPRNAVVPDNIRVTVHFVPWLDPTAKLLSGTPPPVLTRARVTTTNQNKTREYISGSLAFGGMALFRNAVKESDGTVFSSALLPQIMARVFNLERLYGWKLNSLRKSSTTAELLPR